MNENFEVQTFDVQDTIPEALNEERENIENNEGDIVTPDNNDSLDENVARDTNATAQKFVSENTTEPFVSIQYNHKNRNFTKEEAINLIQKGMHTEALRNKLEYLARLEGTDVNSVVEKIVAAPEDAYRRHLEELYGENSPDVEIGMAIYREKQSDEYKKIMQEHENSIEEEKRVKSVYSRLANEYINLKHTIPEAPEYSQLPDAVIIEAAEGKSDLCSAYLRYMYNENKKINDAKKTQNAAKDASTGSMGKDRIDNITSHERGFLSGLWTK